MSGRKLNPLEQKIHQAALASDDKTLTSKDLEALAPDAATRMAAVNFLASTGLLKVMKDAKGKVLLRAVGKREVEAKKDLSPEEALVLSHIQASGNEGIWTKHIKVRTELHQTVLDRCLKSLTQKGVIKALKGSAQHPTRKIYMLSHLEPSAEVTGGPWYTDKELDTEFIKMLLKACLKFIRDRSVPRTKSSAEGQRLLYRISDSPAYPSPAQIQAFLNKSRITETQLTVEHVEMLMEVLVLDGEVERIPAMGAALWESSANDDAESSSSESEVESRKSKKRKRKDKDRDEGSSSRKKKRRRSSSSDEDSSDESDDNDKKRKKKKRRRSDSDATDESASEDDRKKKKKSSSKRKKRKTETSESDSESDSGSDDDSDGGKKKRGKSKSSSSSSKSKSKKRKHESSSDTDSSDSESDSRSRRNKSKSKSKVKKRSSSPAMPYNAFENDGTAGVYVYRAINTEKLMHFGWHEAPCGRCPVFDFCKSGGPVNPQECVYYGDWLAKAEVKQE